MSKFKVGDRVATYTRLGRFTGELLHIEDGYAEVRLDGDNDSEMFHAKQLRRLKPRAKAREFWLQLGGWTSTTQQAGYATITPSVIVQTQPSDPEKWIHVREVRRKK